MQRCRKADMDPARTSRTDLVIVGAGPAGLMAAAWAKQYNVSTRILDDKPDRVKTGHADGLTCRTMEIFDSFGLADIVVSESCQDHFMRSWVCAPFACFPSPATNLVCNRVPETMVLVLSVEPRSPHSSRVSAGLECVC